MTPVAIGIKILSLTWRVENSSINVMHREAMSTKCADADKNENIMAYVIMKKDTVPSSDLLNNFVLPNLIPIRAAAESDRLITNIEIKAIFSLKIHIDIPAPKKTHVAPEKA